MKNANIRSQEINICRFLEILRDDHMTPLFIGRQEELKKINDISKLNKAQLIVISGRRRIGKSRLVAHFADPYRYYKFSGLAPRPGVTAQDQRNEFMRQFATYFNIPIAGISDWGTLFDLLASQTSHGRIIILLDEISWMAEGDPDFLGKLKNSWDDAFSQNPELILFLCGSVSTWIEKNLLSSTAFLGRPSLKIRLKQLPLTDCVKFWGKQAAHISSYEKLKLLSVTGGVPRYLELINPNETAEENITRLFFNEEGILFDEYTYIFQDIYGNKSELYQRIVNHLVDRPATQAQITQMLGLARSGDVGDYLEALIIGGFVARDYTWQIKTGKVSSLSKYRLSDNYLRFALKYINPNRELIKKGHFKKRSLRSLPGWDAIMGLQFENLILNNTHLIINQLNINEADIIFDNPYFQRKTTRSHGCQIDYMIQTRHDTLYICEIKFYREPVDINIIEEMKIKLERLQAPKNISKRPILIHVNGVTEQVIDANYFTKIISLDDLIKYSITS